MKIKKLQTMDFMGIAGTKEFDFDKITALCDGNGTGKSSVICALRYCLTGLEPQGEIVHKGATRCAVQVDMGDGTSFCRVKYAAKGKPSKYILNRHTVTMAVYNDGLSKIMNGIPVQDAKILTSGELISGLTSQKFGELLLRYMPEEMTKQDVISRVPLATENMKAIMEKALPDGEFGTEILNKFYSLCYERRKAVRAKVKAEETVLKNYEELNRPVRDAKDAQDELLKLQALRDDAVLYEQKKAAYDKAVETGSKCKKAIEELDRKISAEKVVPHTEEEKKNLEEAVDGFKKAAETARVALHDAEANGRALKKAINTISQPVCPLSGKIHCTTDKTVVLQELQDNLKTCAGAYNTHKKAAEEADKKAAAISEKLKKLNSDIEAAHALEVMKKQREMYVKMIPEIPENPKRTDTVESIDKRLSVIRQDISLAENVKKVGAIKQKIDSHKALMADYDALTDAFSPKGAVKQSFTAYYLDEFASPCSKKANELFPGMDIRFVSDNGVSIQIDPKGDGQYVSFQSLSGGEMACVSFVLMSMFAQLSGTGIIVLDELSVLDNDAFTRLLDVLRENSNEYDMAVIAAVNHDDTVKTLSDRGINVIAMS